MAPQYDGARIEGLLVTLEFIKKMMHEFKHQKGLHRGYFSFLEFLIKISNFVLLKPLNLDVCVVGMLFTLS